MTLRFTARVDYLGFDIHFWWGVSPPLACGSPCLMERSYGDVSLLQGSADSRMHTRFQEIPPDVKVPLIRISAVVTMPSKKKH